MVRGGNTATDLTTGILVRTEALWSAYFDQGIGQFVAELAAAAFGSDEMATAALGVASGAVGLPFRPPAAAEHRLHSTMSVHEALQAAKADSLQDFEQAIADHLGVNAGIVADLGLSEDELRAIAEDASLADRAALQDLITGPLSSAMLARDQWLKAQPVHVTVQVATGQARFQIADWGLLTDEIIDSERHATLSPLIWTDVNDFVEESRWRGPRGSGRALEVSLAVTPELRVSARFNGRRSGSHVGGCTCEDVDDKTVLSHNRRQFDRAAYWVFGDP